MPPVTDPIAAFQSSVGVDNPTILIVDDSRLMRHALKKMLKDDFNLLEAADGEEAWETLLAEPNIQAIFSDLSMPNLDGYGLLERVRSCAETRISRLPFVVITGKEGDHSSLREEAQTRGANDIVCKPFKSEEIVGMTKTFLLSGEQSDAGAEAQRQAEETAQLAAEQEARRIAEEAEAQRQVEETARLAAEQEARRVAEEAEAQRQAEATARLAAEQEARRVAEEAEAQRLAEATERLAAEQEARRVAEEAEAQRQAEETARLAAEQEARRIAEESEAQRLAEATARLAAEQEARRVAEEAEAQRLAEATERLAAEQEALRTAEAEAREYEALEVIHLAPDDTAEHAANDDESQHASEAVAETAAVAEQLVEGDNTVLPDIVEPPRFPPLTRLCIRLALPLLYLGNRLLRLKKDKQLSALRKRL